MKYVVYHACFTGHANPIGTAGGLFRVTAITPDVAIRTTIRRDASSTAWRPIEGETAMVEAEVTFTSPTAFQEIGTITVGEDKILHFSSVRSGYLGQSAHANRRYGAVICQVDRGDRQWLGATGLITSNLLVDAHLSITDYHVGVLLLP